MKTWLPSTEIRLEHDRAAKGKNCPIESPLKRAASFPLGGNVYKVSPIYFLMEVVLDPEEAELLRIIRKDKKVKEAVISYAKTAKRDF